MRHTRSLIACAGLLLWGCLGTDVGNPEDEPDEILVNEDNADGTVSVTTLPLEEDGGAADSRPQNNRANVNPGRLTTADGVEIKAAWVAVDGLLFCQRRADKEPLCQRHKLGPAALNLLTGETKPERIKALSKSGVYDTISFTYTQNPAAGIRSGVEALRDAALYLEGVTPDGRAFSITDVEGGEITFEPQGGARLEKGDNLFALKLDPDKWLSAAALDGTGDDPVVISRTTNIPLFAYFERAFQTSTSLIYDQDRDGDMSEEERRSPLASGD